MQVGFEFMFKAVGMRAGLFQAALATLRFPEQGCTDCCTDDYPKALRTHVLRSVGPKSFWVALSIRVGDLRDYQSHVEVQLTHLPAYQHGTIMLAIIDAFTPSVH